MLAFQSYYYVERKGTAPYGKLYNKYRNWKNSLTRKSNPPKKAKYHQFQVAQDEGEHIRKLKNEFQAMTYEEKMRHWAACAATRMNTIKDIENTSKQIIDIWPQYKSPDGFRLVRLKFHKKITVFLLIAIIFLD